MAREQIFYEDVHPGDVLPVLTVAVDERQLFFFSAATYNGHRIHYDKDWARTVEGYDDVIVQGPLQAALLARAITDWIGGRGRLVEYSVQNRAVAIAGEELNFGGSVTAKRLADNVGLVDLEIAGRRGDTVLMPGTATVALPLRGDQPRRVCAAMPRSSESPNCRPSASNHAHRHSPSTSTRCWPRWLSTMPVWTPRWSMA